LVFSSLKVFSIFILRAFAFILIVFASLSPQLQSSLIISQLQLWHWVIIQVTAYWVYLHIIVPYQAFHYTTPVISIESHTVDNDATHRISPLFHSTKFLFAAYCKHSKQYQGFCLTLK